MKDIIILLIVATFFLLLLCFIAMVFIIKLLKAQNEYAFFFKGSRRLYDLAFQDDLTHLLNRNAYIRDLKTLERRKCDSLWFSIFDIDDFKKTNDTNGHLYGDEILVSAANRLRKVFYGKKHIIYRIGGDEFLVISKDVSENELINLLLNLKEAELDSLDFRFSKGYSIVENKNYKGFNLAFDNADKMLYADKNSKKTNL